MQNLFENELIDSMINVPAIEFLIWKHRVVFTIGDSRLPLPQGLAVSLFSLKRAVMNFLPTNNSMP